MRLWAGIVGCTLAAMIIVGIAPARAQGGGSSSPPPPPPPLVSVSARDAEVRTVLADMFQQAKVANYTVANDVVGRVTISLKDKPFEDALTLLCKAASPELSWSKIDNFYEVKLRRVRRVADENTPLPQVPEAVSYPGGERFERIPLMYTDPRTILAVLNALRPEGMTAAVAYLPTNGLFVRYGGAGEFLSGVINDMPPGFPGGFGNFTASGTGGNGGDGGGGQAGGGPAGGAPGNR